MNPIGGVNKSSFINSDLTFCIESETFIDFHNIYRVCIADDSVKHNPASYKVVQDEHKILNAITLLSGTISNF